MSVHLRFALGDEAALRVVGAPEEALTIVHRLIPTKTTRDAAARRYTEQYCPAPPRDSELRPA